MKVDDSAWWMVASMAS
jgi:hypothetical protein